MCVLIEHYYSCSHPVPSIKSQPQSNHSAIQVDSDRQECSSYLKSIPCKLQILKTTLKQTLCPDCNVYAQQEKRLSVRTSLSKAWSSIVEQASNLVSPTIGESPRMPRPLTNMEKRYGVVASPPPQGNVMEKKATGYWEQKDEREELRKLGEKDWLRESVNAFLGGGRGE